MSLYILREKLASKKLRKPIWFQQMTGIGPMTTPHLKMAATFRTKREALDSPAARFWLTVFEVERAPKRLMDYLRGR